MVGKCVNCEARKGMTHFKNETFTIEHAGATTTVKGLSGWRCEPCGEVEFDADSARRYAAAGDELVLRDRQRQSKEIRRIRRKLGLKSGRCRTPHRRWSQCVLSLRTRRGRSDASGPRICFGSWTNIQSS